MLDYFFMYLFFPKVCSVTHPLTGSVIWSPHPAHSIRNGIVTESRDRWLLFKGFWRGEVSWDLFERPQLLKGPVGCHRPQFPFKACSSAESIKGKAKQSCTWPWMLHERNLICISLEKMPYYYLWVLMKSTKPFQSFSIKAP